MSETSSFVMRALLAVCILAWLAHRVGLESILDQLSHVSLPLVLAATALLALDGATKARNWQQLLVASVGDAQLRFREVLRWHYAGGFVGATVPSSAGTDACRVWLGVRGLGGHAAPCAAAILTVNCFGWFTGSLIGLAGTAMLAHGGALPGAMRIVALVFVVAVVALPIAYGVLASKRAAMATLIERVGRRSDRLRDGLRKFLDALLVFEQAHVRFPVFLFVSALGLMAQTGMFALTAMAIGIDLPFAVWMILVPLTRLVALVPVSVADFGLIQAAHVSVLALFGVPLAQSFVLSALFAVEGLLIHSTLGSCAFLLGSRRATAAAAM